MTEQKKEGLKRTLVGRVVSDKMIKSVIVSVETKVKHAIYGKYMVKTRRYAAHDETNSLVEGDLVEIIEGRPVSKTKSWVVSKVLEKARII